MPGHNPTMRITSTLSPPDAVMFKIASLAAISGALLVNRLGTGDILVIVGAAIFGFATWRSGTAKTLREANDDLRSRTNDYQLEVEQAKAENLRLSTEVEALRHRTDVSAVARAVSDVATMLSQQSDMLAEIHVAVVPPQLPPPVKRR